MTPSSLHYYRHWPVTWSCDNKIVKTTLTRKRMSSHFPSTRPYWSFHFILLAFLVPENTTGFSKLLFAKTIETLLSQNAKTRMSDMTHIFFCLLALLKCLCGTYCLVVCEKHHLFVSFKKTKNIFNVTHSARKPFKTNSGFLQWTQLWHVRNCSHFSFWKAVVTWFCWYVSYVTSRSHLHWPHNTERRSWRDAQLSFTNNGSRP